MHCWPECPVCETIIIFPTIKWRQVQEHVLDIFFVDYSGQRIRLGCHPAAPAEPEPLIALKRLSQCNGQSTRCAFAGDVGNRDAVRIRNVRTWPAMLREKAQA